VSCAAGDDRGDDGQEQSGGADEDKLSDRMVAVALAIGPYRDCNSSHDGAHKQQPVHLP
jgi:hypothetical protein